MFGLGCFGNAYGRGYASGGFYGMSPFMMIPMIIFWAVLIYFLIKLFMSRKAEYQSGSSSAIDILDERFANGEINEEEYIAKKKQLRR